MIRSVAPAATATPESNRKAYITRMTFARINYIFVAVVTAMLAMVVTTLEAAPRKLAMAPTKTLSAEDSRRFDYFFLEAQRQSLRENYAGAYDLLNHCRDIDPQAAEPYFFLSSYCSALGRDSLALAYLNRAVSLRPDNQTYLETLARTYYSTQNYDKAASVYENLIKTNRDRTDLLHVLLGIYERQKDYNGMLDCLDRIERIEGSGEDITLSKVNVYGLKGDRKSAAAVLRKLVAEHPYDLNYQLMMGNWLMQNNGRKKALAIFMDVLAKEPENVNVLGSLYDYYKAVGQDDQAVDYLKRFIVSPHAEAKSKLAMMKTFFQENDRQGGDSTQVLALFDQLGVQGDMDAAMAELKLAYLNLKKFPEVQKRQAQKDLLKVSPGNVQVRYDLVQAFWREQKWDDVILLSREGTEYAPDELAFYYLLGLSCYQKHENDSALNALRKGVEVAGKDGSPNIVSDLYSMIGSILQEKGQLRQAYDAFENSLKWKGDNVECLNNYAYFLCVQDTALSKAAEMSYKTIIEEPKNPTFLDTYAWILFRQDRYAEAKIYIDQAVANDTDTVQSAVILEHAGDIYAKNGLPERALDYWQRAVKAGGDSPLLPEKIKQKKYIDDDKKKNN